MSGARPEASAEERLADFMAKYDPAIMRLAEQVLGRMRMLVSGAVEMVYDNYNALVIGFGPTDRASDAVMSIALYPRWVSLFFLKGASLPDPEQRLKGTGRLVRNIVLETPAVLEDPAVQTLIRVALEQSGAPWDPRRGRRLIIKSVSARQRPRRPGG